MDITQWYEALPLVDKVFLYSAMFGSIFFVLRMLMLLIGGFGDHDMGDDAGHDIGDDISTDVDSTDGDFSHDHAHDSSASFHLLTIQGFTAFFMMGGFSGLYFSQNLQVGSAFSAFLAGSVGVIAMFACAYLIKLLMSLQSDGTVDMRNAMLQEGEVYLTVKPGSGGKVQLELQQRLVVYDAITEGDEDLKTGERVVVVRILNGTTLVVSRAI